MGFEVEYDDANDLCTLRVVGRYGGLDDTRAAQRIVASAHAERGFWRVLIDMTQADVSVNTLDIFEAGNPQGEMAAHLRKLKSAFLYREITENLRLLETVATNRGFRVRVFDQHDKALEWLREG
jgi:hypothetical protein